MNLLRIRRVLTTLVLMMLFCPVLLVLSTIVGMPLLETLAGMIVLTLQLVIAVVIPLLGRLLRLQLTEHYVGLDGKVSCAYVRIGRFLSSLSFVIGLTMLCQSALWCWSIVASATYTTYAAYTDNAFLALDALSTWLACSYQANVVRTQVRNRQADRRRVAPAHANLFAVQDGAQTKAPTGLMVHSLSGKALSGKSASLMQTVINWWDSASMPTMGDATANYTNTQTTATTGTAMTGTITHASTLHTMSASTTSASSSANPGPHTNDDDALWCVILQQLASSRSTSTFARATVPPPPFVLVAISDAPPLTDARQLNFRKGDVFGPDAIDAGSGWIWATLDGKRGIVHSTYVRQRLVDAPAP